MRARTRARAFSVDGPALVLFPARMSHDVALSPHTRGFVVTLHEQGLNHLSAREPNFGRLFREQHILPLDEESRQFHNLETSISSLLRERLLPAPARVTAIRAHVQLLLTNALRLLEQTRPQDLPVRPSQPSRCVRLVDTFLALVAAHGCDRWRLRDYAEALHVSPDHLRASCVQVTGNSPLQHIHAYVLQEAKEHLARTALPIRAIALELGYDDPAYFSRLFRTKIGVSPTQYRVASRHGAQYTGLTRSGR